MLSIWNTTRGVFSEQKLKLDIEEVLGRKGDLGTYRSIRGRLREHILAKQVKIL